jgi:hypothetical protein
MKPSAPGHASSAADGEQHPQRVARDVHDAAAEDEQRPHRGGEQQIEVGH